MILDREARAHDQVRSSLRSDHHHLGADLDPFIEIDHVLVAHADAAGRDRRSDRPGLVRAVDTIERRAEIHRAGAERILRPAFHVARQIGAALEHFGRRRPIRPFTLARNLADARPGEAGPADADAVADRGAVALDEIQEALVGIDDDGAAALVAIVVDDLLQVARMDRLFTRLAVLPLSRIEWTLKWLVARRVVIAWATEQQFEEAAAEIGALGEPDRRSLHVSGWSRAATDRWIEIERAGSRRGDGEGRDDCGQDETLH